MNTLITVEMDNAIQQWLEGYCHQNNMTFSEAVNHQLMLARQVTENENAVSELSIPQKLLLQCSVESLLILKELLQNKEALSSLNEKARNLIRSTLGLADTPCPSS